MINLSAPDYANTPVSPGRTVPAYRPLDQHAPAQVTILTPFYNTGAVFLETAASVLQQTFQQWEWLIVNDGSSDPAALALLAPFRGGDARIRVIDLAVNAGLSAARNSGFQAASTPFVVLLDSDDLLEPTAVEEWYWYLETHPESAFVSSCLVCFGAKNYHWSGGFRDGAANLERNRITSVGMVRKEVHAAAGGYDETIRGGLEDWEFWMRCASLGYWGEMLPDTLAWIRTRTSHADRWENLQEERIQAFREDFRRRFPHLYQNRFPALSEYTDIDLRQLPRQVGAENRIAKEKPRLLVMVPWLVVGGAERFDLDLIRQLVRHGWEVTVLATAPSDHPWQAEFEALSADVFCLERFLPWENYPAFCEYIIRSRQVDGVLIASSREAYRLLPVLRAAFPRLPILDYLHFVTPDWMDGGIPRLSVLFQAFLDQTVVSSAQLRQWMLAEGLDEARVDICTTNIDHAVWHPDPDVRRRVRQAAGLPADLPLILYVARIEQQKQPLVFAETILRLKQSGESFQAVVIGDGSLLPTLEDAIRANDLQSAVRLLGRLPGPQVMEWMQAGDILFLPSENEGIALVFFEAMACGLVVVGADVGGQAELVTAECGLLLARGADEAERYAQALCDLLRHPQRRAALSAAARQRSLDCFDVGHMGERMLALIEKARQAAQIRLPLTAEDLQDHLARQTVEYFSAYDLARELQDRFGSVYRKYKDLVDHPPMPVASPTTYFYFGVRAILFPLYRKLLGGDTSPFARLIKAVKRRMVAIKPVIYD